MSSNLILVGSLRLLTGRVLRRVYSIVLSEPIYPPSPVRAASATAATASSAIEALSAAGVRVRAFV